MNRVFKVLLWFVSIVSIVTLGKVLIERYEVEKKADQVEIVLDYSAFDELAEISIMKGEKICLTLFLIKQKKRLLKLRKSSIIIFATTFLKLSNCCTFLTKK